MCLRRLFCSLVVVGGVCSQSALPLSTAAAAPPLELAPVIVEPEFEEGERDQTSAVQSAAPGAFQGALDGVSAQIERMGGVQLRTTGGFGRSVGVSLRGTDAQQALVLLDDVPFNLGLAGGVDLTQLDWLSAERVELYRGGSSLFGAYALGGVVRVITAPISAEPVTTASAQFGSFDTASLAGRHSSKHGGVGVSASYSLWRSQGDFPFEDHNGRLRRRENNDTRGIQLSGRIETSRQPGERLSITGRTWRAERGMPGVEQFPSENARQEDARESVVARGEWTRLAGGSVQASTSGWLQTRRVAFRDPQPLMSPPIANFFQDSQVGGFADLRWAWLEWMALGARAEVAFEWAEVDRGGNLSYPQRETAGLVLTDELSLWADRLLVVSALRMDVSQGEPVWLPKFGAIGAISDSVRLRGNVSRAYRPPSFEELYFDTGSIKGNPSLGPESAWSFDLGVELAWSTLRMSATWFLLEIDNLIVFLPTSAFLIMADDSRAARSQGAEVTLDWNPLSWLTLGLGYTGVDARFLGSGRKLPGRSPHLFHSLLAFRWRGMRADLSLDWQDAFSLDRFEQLQEESRWTLNARVSARAERWLEIALEGRNLMDKRDGVDSLQQPLSGVSLLATVAVRQ